MSVSLGIWRTVRIPDERITGKVSNQEDAAEQHGGRLLRSHGAGPTVRSWPPKTMSAVPHLASRAGSRSQHGTWPATTGQPAARRP